MSETGSSPCTCSFRQVEQAAYADHRHDECPRSHRCSARYAKLGYATVLNARGYTWHSCGSMNFGGGGLSRGGAPAGRWAACAAADADPAGPAAGRAWSAGRDEGLGGPSAGAAACQILRRVAGRLLDAQLKLAPERRHCGAGIPLGESGRRTDLTTVGTV
jgi:hypothetical protein